MAILDDQTLSNARRAFDLVRIEATLGDASGIVWDDPVNRPGYMRVRYKTAAGLSVAAICRLGMNCSVPPSAGQSIYLGYEGGELVIKGANVGGQIAAGINPAYNNAAKLPEKLFVPTSAIVPLSSGPTSPESLSVWVASLIYVEDRTVYHFHSSEDGGSGTPKGKIDLTSYVPSAGNHRLAGLFLKTDNTIAVSASTTQTMDIPLDLTDIQECLTGSSAGSKPVWCWYLHDAQTTITEADSYLDFRGFINQSQVALNSIQTDANGNVQVDANGNVIYV